MINRTTGSKLSGLLIGAGLAGLLLAAGALWYAALYEGQSSATPATLDNAMSGFVKLAWDRSPSDEVKGYRILLGQRPGTYTSAVDVGNTTTTTLTGLRSGARYYIVVTAVDEQGHVSPPSNEIEVLISK